MRKLSWRTGVLAAALFAAARTCGTVLAQTATEIETAAAGTVRDLDLQAEMPTQLKTIRELNPYDFFDFLPNSLGEVLLWGAVILGAVLVIYAFREYIYLPAIARRGGDDRNDGDGNNGAHAPASAAEAETTADELARQGRFMEAMHVLLLRAVTELRMRLNEHYADSLTSREIMRRARIPETGRMALKEIITRVEWTYFGAYPAEHADYAVCRENFTRLISGLESAGRS